MSWRCVVKVEVKIHASLTSHLEKEPHYPLGRRPSGPQSQSECYRIEKNPCLCQESNSGSTHSQSLCVPPKCRRMDRSQTCSGHGDKEKSPNIPARNQSLVIQPVVTHFIENVYIKLVINIPFYVMKPVLWYCVTFHVC